MFKDKRIITLLAHPDDETLGCGGTIHKAVGEGAIVKCVIPVKRVADDCAKALEALGVSSVHFGKFDDNQMDKYPLNQVSAFFESQIEEFKPNIVFLHHWGCTNQDHRVCYEAGVIANRNNKAQLICCEIPSSTGYLKPVNFEPNLYITLDQWDLDAKADALRDYHTEVRPYPHVRSVEKIGNWTRFRGGEINKEYAEAFLNIREIV